MNTPEINALLRLLVDEEPSVRTAVADRLRQLGAAGIAALEEACDAEDARLRVRARNVLLDLRRDQVATELSNLLRQPKLDLESAVILLARTQQPLADPARIRVQLDRLGSLLAARLADLRDPEAKAVAIGEFFANEEGFKGNAKEYYDPRNSYIDEVLSRRCGIPISLATVYVLAGRRAGLSIQGVGMPMHFLVHFEEGGSSFLLDPFGGGRILTRDACKALLTGVKKNLRDDDLRPISDRDMFRRIVANLVRIYGQRGDFSRLQRLSAFVTALQTAVS